MDRTRAQIPSALRHAAFLAATLSGLVVLPHGASADSAVLSEVSVDAGQSVLLRFVPDPKYRLSDVRIDGVSVGAVSSYRLQGVTKDVNVDATFVSEVEILLPTLAGPVSGGTVTSKTPVLSVYNPLLEGTATYEFQVALDSAFEHIVASEAGVVQGLTTTSWTVSLPLTDNTRYYWRVRASEGGDVGPWMEPDTFLVNSAGVDTAVTVQISGYMLGGSANVFEVPGSGNGAKGLSVEADPGSLGFDTIFAAGSVTNAPAAASGTKVLGAVYELSPHAVPFLKPVTLKLPYTDADVAAAGVSGPEQLRVLTYNTDTFAWESVTVTAVDRVNKQLVCQVNHFSLYALGTDSGTGSSNGGGQTVGVSSAAPSSGGSGGGGGGGGGCFIGSAAQDRGTGSGRGATWILCTLAGALVLMRRTNSPKE